MREENPEQEITDLKQRLRVALKAGFMVEKMMGSKSKKELEEMEKEFEGVLEELEKTTDINELRETEKALRNLE